MTSSFNFLTYNVKGLQNKCKRLKIFNYVHDKIQNNGVCFLQETHSTPDCEDTWKQEWGGDFFFSHGSSNSTGAAICFSKNMNMDIVKISTDTSGRIVILEIIFNDDKYLLINLYNDNKEIDQLKTLEILEKLLEKHDIDGECHPIFGGDFNVIFDTLLDASGGNPTLKKRSLAKFVHINEKLDVCDILRVRFPNLKRFTFCRLDYIFLSNNLQEFVTNIDIIPAFLSDHSPVLATIDTNNDPSRGRYGWKFNSSLLNDPVFIATQKDNITNTINSFEANSNPHLKWEILKYEIRKFCISYSKAKNRQKNILKENHENIVKKYESTDDKPSEQNYIDSKIFLDNLIDERTNGAILRSKSQW